MHTILATEIGTEAAHYGIHPSQAGGAAWQEALLSGYTHEQADEAMAIAESVASGENVTELMMAG